MENSIRAVAPEASITALNPLGRGGCGHIDSQESREVVVHGLSDDRARALRPQVVTLWKSFGYDVHGTATADFVAINGYHISVETRADVPFSIGGSTPCVDDDATRIRKTTDMWLLYGGLVAAALFLAFALTVVPNRHRLRLGDDPAKSLRAIFWTAFALSLLSLLYGLFDSMWIYFNNNSF